MSDSTPGAMTHTVREFNVKETAAELRKALRQEFPGVKFSVRMATGTAHGWLDVSYVDGPRYEPVRALCDRFESSRFDGQDDAYHSVEPTRYATDDGGLYEPRYTCCGINITRDHSDTALDWARSLAGEGSIWWALVAGTWATASASDLAYYSARRLLAATDLTDPSNPSIKEGH